jgi:hypothetical protein
MARSMNSAPRRNSGTRPGGVCCSRPSDEPARQHRHRLLAWVGLAALTDTLSVKAGQPQGGQRAGELWLGRPYRRTASWTWCGYWERYQLGPATLNAKAIWPGRRSRRWPVPLSWPRRNRFPGVRRLRQRRQTAVLAQARLVGTGGAAPVSTATRAEPRECLLKGSFVTGSWNGLDGEPGDRND